MYKQGEIYFFNLNPTKGREERKTRPCIIISNDDYNSFFNTVIIIPISSSQKYEELRFKMSPLFVSINQEKIHGTALLQHLRTVDPKYRIIGSLQGRLKQNEISTISHNLKQFF